MIKRSVSPNAVSFTMEAIANFTRGNVDKSRGPFKLTRYNPVAIVRIKRQNRRNPSGYHPAGYTPMCAALDLKNVIRTIASNLPKMYTTEAFSVSAHPVSRSCESAFTFTDREEQSAMGE